MFSAKLSSLSSKSRATANRSETADNHARLDNQVRYSSSDM